jgi:hypothetical protein
MDGGQWKIAVVGATTLKPLYRPPHREARRYNVTL